jgi:hypothetical protein
MRYIQIILPLFLICCLISCSEPDEASASVDHPATYGAFEDASKSPDASITHDDKWTIVSRMENGDRVYWFVAPDVNQTSPALFKKTVHTPGKNEKETVTVSKCDAPKQTCDDLMEQFKALSVKYR